MKRFDRLQALGVPDWFLSQDEAAAVVGVSKRTLIRWIRSGHLVVDGYIGRQPRIRWTTVMRFVERFPAFSYRATSASKNQKSVQTGRTF